MNILFLCTGNSCRSQMAQGWARHLLKTQPHTFHSAGVKKSFVNEKAIAVMAEVGVDISEHHSKELSELPVERMDLVFTVCSSARESCPVFPAGKIVHAGFDDPPPLTAHMTDEEAILSVYRRVRDEIKHFVENLESHYP